MTDEQFNMLIEAQKMIRIPLVSLDSLLKERAAYAAALEYDKVLQINQLIKKLLIL